jgi:hypothetical protein
MYAPICDGIFKVPLRPKKSGQFFCLRKMKRTKKEPSKNGEIPILAILTYLPKKPRFTFAPFAESCFFSESFRVIFLPDFGLTYLFLSHRRSAP